MYSDANFVVQNYEAILEALQSPIKSYEDMLLLKKLLKTLEDTSRFTATFSDP
jgi:hypothetical protein